MTDDASNWLTNITVPSGWTFVTNLTVTNWTFRSPLDARVETLEMQMRALGVVLLAAVIAVTIFGVAHMRRKWREMK